MNIHGGELKDSFWLDHFEARSFQGWYHHVTLVSPATVSCRSNA